MTSLWETYIIKEGKYVNIRNSNSERVLQKVKSNYRIRISKV